MASVYKPKDKNHWYISYVDPDTGKTKNKSTKLLAIKENKKIAEKICSEFEKEIENRKNELIKFNLNKSSIESAFKHFIKINSDKAPTTINEYHRFFKYFIEQFNPGDSCTVISKIPVEDWVLNIKKQFDEPNTQYVLYKILNKFLNFLFEYSYTPVFKINKNIKPKPIVKQIKVFHHNDLNKLIKNLSTRKKNSNFRTMFYMLLYTGLRPTDLIDVKVEDIDLQKMTLSYYERKIKVYTIIPLHNKLKSILSDRIKIIKSGRIFEYASISEMGKAFRRYLRRIKLNDKDYNLRTFRKNFATSAFESGISLLAASKLLGHKTMQTTQKYYTHVDKQLLAAELPKLKFKRGVKRE